MEGIPRRIKKRQATRVHDCSQRLWLLWSLNISDFGVRPLQYEDELIQEDEWDGSGDRSFPL